MKAPIIISVYNNQKTIEDALKSVFNQIYQIFEYIVLKEFYYKYDSKFKIASYYNFIHGLTCKYKIPTTYLQKVLYKI